MPFFSRPTLGCMAVCAVVLGIAIADFAHVQSRLPDAPILEPPNCGSSTACIEERNAQVQNRYEEGARLEQQFESRAWLYACLIIAAVAVAAGVALKTKRRIEWQRVFTNLGIAGVWSGILATVLLVIADGEALEPPAVPAYVPAVAMICAAAVGTLMGRTHGWGDTDAVAEARAGATAVGKWALGGLLAGSRRESVGRFFSTWAFAFTGATIVLALIFMEPQPSCGGGGFEQPPDWTDTIAAIAGITSIGAIAAGVGGLLLRRWLPALVSLVVNPIVLFLMAASTCAFY
jgi:hypothetical protein